MATNNTLTLRAAVLLALVCMSMAVGLRDGHSSKLSKGPPYKTCSIKGFSDGESYFAELVDYVQTNTEDIERIAIVGWQVDPYVALTDEVTLKELLHNFAEAKMSALGDDTSSKPDFVRMVYWQPAWTEPLNSIAAEAQGEKSQARLELIRTLLHKPSIGVHVLPLTYSITSVSNHQKFVILQLKGGHLVEYLGGLDLAFVRRDSYGDSPRNSCQGALTTSFEEDWKTAGKEAWLENGIGCTPWHDVQVRVEGAVDEQLSDVFHDRWIKGKATDELLKKTTDKLLKKTMPHFEGSTDLPDQFLAPQREDVASPSSSLVDGGHCRVVQTAPNKEETLPPLIDWIKSAKRYVYIENQYFVSPPYYSTLDRAPTSLDYWRFVVKNGLARAIREKIEKIIKDGCKEEFTAIIVMPLQTFSAEISRLSRKSLNYGPSSLYGLTAAALKSKKKGPTACRDLGRTPDDFVVPAFLAKTSDGTTHESSTELRSEEDDPSTVKLEEDELDGVVEEKDGVLVKSEEVGSESGSSQEGHVSSDGESGEDATEIVVRPLPDDEDEALLQTRQEVTFQYQTVFTHTKLMIVDDRHAYVGSANINDRSLKKTRMLVYSGDVEVGVTFGCGDKSVSDCESNAAVVDLKNKLWRQHLGVDSVSDNTIGEWKSITKTNLDTIRVWQNANPTKLLDPTRIPESAVMCTRSIQEVTMAECTELSPCELKGHAVRIPDDTFPVKGSIDTKSCGKTTSVLMSRLKNAALLGEWI